MTAKPPDVTHLEGLLFKATNPSNKVEDVNTIKLFCDLVAETPEMAPLASRMLAHKIQSPQDREALQALAVLEACMKGCGRSFQTEIGKFRFLNEMIKLVSPNYLGSRTPEHIKKKVIELLYKWKCEVASEAKIGEAYEMLKKQGVINADPDYVGGAVFASSLPPRRSEPLSAEKSAILKRLLQSKNPEDLLQANKLIKELVHEDERKMDLMLMRSTEITVVRNNVTLLSDMLDHYDRSSAAGRTDELEVMKELYESCEKMQSKLFHMASDEGETSIGDILSANDEVTQVIARYKMVVAQGKPDMMKRQFQRATTSQSQSSHNRNSDSASLPKAGGDQLLDLMSNVSESKSLFADDDFMSLAIAEQPKPTSDLVVTATAQAASCESTFNAAQTVSKPSVDDLLNGALMDHTAPAMSLDTLMLSENACKGGVALVGATGAKTVFDMRMEEARSSRQKGLEELDMLGEFAIKSQLPNAEKSPRFDKHKLSMNQLSQKQSQRKQHVPGHIESVITSSAPLASPENKVAPAELANNSPQTMKNDNKEEVSKKQSIDDTSSVVHVNATPLVKFEELHVPIQSIKPSNIPPVPIQSEDNSVDIILNFGRDQSVEHVYEIVVTLINKSSYVLTNLDLKVVVPKGCKSRLQAASGDSLPAHNPFVPPAAITQVLLVFIPEKRQMSLKYVLSFVQDGEPQTELGEAKQLPIP